MQWDGWALINDGTTLLLTGPGQLEIALRQFDARRAMLPESLPREMLGALRQRGVEYPLDETTTLELILTDCPSQPQQAALYSLHIGNAVSWRLPAGIAEALYRRLAPWAPAPRVIA
jgi:hypothetical protein